MIREQVRRRIEEIGIIPAIRVSSPEDALFAADAVCTHGIPIVEVTMTVPGAIGVISELTAKNSNLITGAGSISAVETARRCLDAGAQFLTSTGLNLDLVHFAVGRDVVVFPGALTPTEVMAAWETVPGGAVSTGSFTSMLASIFGNSGARFTYDGDSTRGGRLLSEFGFHVPREKSQYLYVFGSSRERNVAMAYEGTVFADPQTSDLVRLRIRTEQPPEETGVCELDQDLEYARVHMNSGDFLLPSEAQVTVIHTDGTEAHNRITYSACHEFQGESTVRYEAAAEPERSLTEKPVQTAPFSAPAGLPFKVVFTDRIDTATAAAGDLIGGRLKTAIRDRNEKVLLAEGTPVTGRILGISRFYPQSSRLTEPRKTPARAPSLVINVRLETVEIGGTPQPLKATFDSGVKRFVKQGGPFSVHVDLGSLDELHDHSDDSDAATFEFWESNPDHAVKSGLESNWLTAAR